MSTERCPVCESTSCIGHPTTPHPDSYFLLPGGYPTVEGPEGRRIPAPIPPDPQPEPAKGRRT